MSRFAAKYFGLLLLIALCFGCKRDLSKPQGVVEEFIDQHYVEINLPRAKAYAVSLALDKINEEIRLTAGQAIDASTQKPRVNYKLLEKKEGENRASFLYEGTIQSEDGTSFKRKWLIAARIDGNKWRVSNFSESE